MSRLKLDNHKDQDKPSMWSLQAWTRLVWLAGWLARWLKWKTLEARQLQARRDGSFNNGPVLPGCSASPAPCHPACLDYIRAEAMSPCQASQTSPSKPFTLYTLPSRSCEKHCQDACNMNGEAEREDCV